MFFLILPVFLAEILIFTTWTHFYDFWEVFPFYFLPSIFGAILLARTSQSMATAMKSGSAGQAPGKEMLQQGTRLAAAVCLMIPLFLPRVLAVVLLTPGLRHLAVKFFKTYLQKKMAKSGGFSFIKFGNGAGGGFGSAGPFGQGPFGPGPFGRGPSGRGPFGGAGSAGEFEETRQERDATVVDITPLEITHGPAKGRPEQD